jgi:hypothetical protein
MFPLLDRTVPYYGMLSELVSTKCGVQYLYKCMKLRRYSMKNVEIKVDGNKLMLIVDLSQEFGLSASGKSITVASTEGNVSVPGYEEVKIGLNVYKPRPKN